MIDATEREQVQRFDGVRQVISNDMKFKAKLGIGADAFASLKIGKTLQQLWDLGGVAATGAGAAKSGLVASTLFASSGFWASLGFGATAVTPIGWVIGAAVASGGAYYGVTRLFSGYSESRVVKIPKFLNTPLDLLGASMLDLLGALSLKVAAIDGVIDPSEEQVISTYFVEEWGYDADYVASAMEVLAENADKSRLAEMTTALAEFVHANPDCNFPAIQKEVTALLTEIAEADGHIDEREEMAIERIVRSLKEQNSMLSSVSRLASSSTSAASSAASWVAGKLGLEKSADQAEKS